MTSDAELDEKLARVSARLAAKRASVRGHLEGEPALLALAEAAREILGAKLVYVRVGDFEHGNRAAFDEAGYAYNLDLRPRHAATQPADRHAASATQRSGAKPPRRGKGQGQRHAAKTAARGPVRVDPMAWVDGSGTGEG